MASELRVLLPGDWVIPSRMLVVDGRRVQPIAGPGRLEGLFHGFRGLRPLLQELEPSVRGSEPATSSTRVESTNHYTIWKAFPIFSTLI